MACAICHNTTAATPAGPNPKAPSCFSANFTNALGQARPCHAGGPGSAPHALPFADPSLHGAPAKADLSFCQQCHGPMEDFNLVRKDYNGDGVIEGIQTEVQKLLDKATEARSKRLRIADRAAEIYAPAVHLTALVAAIGWFLAGASLLWRGLQGPPALDYITLAGSGEPTLNLGLGNLIRRIKGLTATPVAVSSWPPTSRAN